MAVAVRAEAAGTPGLVGAQYHDGAVLLAQVQRQAGKYETVVIDAGGRDSSALRAALFPSEVLIVPFLPRSVDVWALADIAGLVEEANEVREGLRAPMRCSMPPIRAPLATMAGLRRLWLIFRNSRCSIPRSGGTKRSRMP